MPCRQHDFLGRCPGRLLAQRPEDPVLAEPALAHRPSPRWRLHLQARARKASRSTEAVLEKLDVLLGDRKKLLKAMPT
jgi:hypothetical protein